MARLDEIYTTLWSAHGDDFAELDRSLGPRSWTFLFDVAATTPLGPQSVIADVGCGRGNHCMELARRFGSRVVGVDLVTAPLRAAVLDPERPATVAFLQGDIERLPIRSESVDFVWCRDMLVHLRDIEAAIGECWRILHDGATMLAWVTTATGLMESHEAARLFEPLAIEAKSVSRQHLEESFRRAGFVITRHEELGSELIEFYEERDNRASRELMRIARMRRMREELTVRWGQARYDSANALYHWTVYHLLGKLSSGYYLLQKCSR
jgi:ubiquinone/menaquinone biosynthesis C-methylase UbiE